MSDQDKQYTGQNAIVRYAPKRCIHFAACVRGLPAVFDPNQRPWIVPDHGDTDALAATVQQCPTGALHIERLDGGPAEQPSEQGHIQIEANGPLYVRGEITVQHDDGSAIASDTRIALCRCGLSGNKPFCDGTHRTSFHDDGILAPQQRAPVADHGPLVITVSTHGPYRVSGPCAISSADNNATHTYQNMALCRCGASQHKPFCDGAHLNVDQEIWQ